MAFTAANFVPSSAMANSDAPRMFAYATSGDTLATVKGANYFNTASDPTGGYGLTNGDVIFVSASDGESFLFIAVDGSGNATTASANDFA